MDIVLDSKTSKILIFKTITTTSLLVGTIGLLQYSNLAFTDIPGFKGWNIFHSTMVNKNIFSISLMLSFPFSLGLIILEYGFWRVVATVSLFISLVCIVISGTRSVWLGVAFMFLSIILLNGVRNKYRNNKQGLFTPSLVRTASFVFLPSIVLSFFIAQQLNTENDIIGRLGSLITIEGETISNRILLWQNTLEIIWNNMLFGIGSGNWAYSTAGLGSDQFLSSSGILMYQRPHNDFLWVSAENGLIVGAFYLMIFVTCFLSGYKALTRESFKNGERTILILMLSTLAAFMFVSFFSFPKERVYVNILLGLIIAMILAAATKHSVSLIRIPRFSLKTVLGVLLITSVCGAGSFGLRFLGEQNIRKMLIARQAGDWKSVISHADKSQELLCPIDHTSTPVSWYKGLAYFSLEDLNRATAEFEIAYRISPNNPQVLNNLATVYQFSGNTPMALELYQRAVNLAPHFQDALLNLTTLYCEEGRYSEASKFWGNVIEEDNPRYNFISRRIKLGLKKENTL
jgi:O-antigen ligase